VIFRRTHGGRLRIGTRALADMNRFRQDEPDAPEAGGILLGRLVVERPDILVDRVTVPSVRDRQSRYHFTRAKGPTQAAIDVAWKESDGIQNYLGEWHTHPEDEPHPSWVDRLNWRRLACVSKYEQDALVFIIVGRSALRAWEVLRSGRSVEWLELEDDRDSQGRA
jgi:integrative and conjugative element protein (TIGR02256 family)